MRKVIMKSVRDFIVFSRVTERESEFSWAEGISEKG